MDKIKVFEKELAWIQNKEIREFVTDCVNNLPDYFFHVPASSTGKYHPAYSLGEGGLVRHTRAAAALAKSMLYLESYNKFTNDDKDIIIAALILHDGFKNGATETADGLPLEPSSKTLTEHPVICAEWVKSRGHGKVSDEVLQNLCASIASHMGQWNTNYLTGEAMLPKPKSVMEDIVHLCDFLGSRKFLDFKFENVNYASDKI